MVPVSGGSAGGSVVVAGGQFLCAAGNVESGASLNGITAVSPSQVFVIVTDLEGGSRTTFAHGSGQSVLVGIDADAEGVFVHWYDKAAAPTVAGITKYAPDGSIAWAAQYADLYSESAGSWHVAGPVRYDESADQVVASGQGVVAIDAGTGAVKWSWGGSGYEIFDVAPAPSGQAWVLAEDASSDVRFMLVGSGGVVRSDVVDISLHGGTLHPTDDLSVVFVSYIVAAQG